MLFSQNADGTIPRTNNGMERFFRKIRRNIRKRSGNNAAGLYLHRVVRSLHYSRICQVRNTGRLCLAMQT